MLSLLREAAEKMMDSGSSKKVLSYITGFIVTQMMAKAGIKKDRQVAIATPYTKNSCDYTIQEFLMDSMSRNSERARREQQYEPSAEVKKKRGVEKSEDKLSPTKATKSAINKGRDYITDPISKCIDDVGHDQCM